MSNGNGHRWSKFWWRDHQGDAALRMCSLAARGLWVELLCLAHEASPVGHVLVNGNAPTPQQIAAITGSTAKEVEKLTAELEAAGVFSRTEDGTIYSRRMIRDEEASEAGREHIAKRWNGARPTSPPNRGGSREPTRKPNGQATSHPDSPPITKKLEADSDPEAEKVKKKDSSPPSGLVGSRARENPAPDSLKTIEAELDIEPPARIDRTDEPEKLSADPRVNALLRRTAKPLEMRIPYGTVRSKVDQLDALEPQPKDVIDIDTSGYRWAPAAPIRSPAQQLAELLGIPLAEAQRRASADIPA